MALAITKTCQGDGRSDTSTHPDLGSCGILSKKMENNCGGHLLLQLIAALKLFRTAFFIVCVPSNVTWPWRRRQDALASKTLSRPHLAYEYKVAIVELIQT